MVRRVDAVLRGSVRFCEANLALVWATLIAAALLDAATGAGCANASFSMTTPTPGRTWQNVSHQAQKCLNPPAITYVYVPSLNVK